MQSTHESRANPLVARVTHFRAARGVFRVSLERYVAFVAVFAAATFAIPPSWELPPERWVAAFVVLTVLSVVLEFVEVPLPRGGVLSLATIPHVATLLLIPPPFASISIGSAVLIEELVRRAPRIKLLFNVAAFVLTARLTALVVGAVGDAWTASAARDHLVLAVLFAVAGVAYYAINAVLSSGVLSAATGERFLVLLRANTRNTRLSELGAATVGALFALIWTVEPMWTALLGVPAAVISRSLQYIRQLESETRLAVRSLAQIVDHRDTTTFHHSERVAMYAVALARELDLGEDTVELVEQAASVHDLGKIGVPDRILLKPSALTDAERTKMWLHTEIGAQILRHFELFREGAEIVLHHHEAYDGTGYPGRLSGDAIPLGARVVAVADAFDAMTSDRPYRTAMPVTEALSRLRAGSGLQWDPQIVGAFIKLVIEERIELPQVPRHDGRARQEEESRDGAETLQLPLVGAQRDALRDLDHPVASRTAATRAQDRAVSS